MPKLKTKKGVAKRFKITGGGKLKRQRAGRGHLLAKKSQKRKRAMRKPALVSRGYEKAIKSLLNY